MIWQMRCTGLLIAILPLAGCGTVPTGPVRHEAVHFDLDKSEVVRVELRMGAGELSVTGGSARLAEADFTYNVDAWKPRVDYHSTGSRGDLTIAQPERLGGAGDVEYKWDVRLNDGVTMDVSAQLGAGKAQMDLGSMDLRGVEVQMGAGELTMDLRGHPKRSYDVRVQGGVGEATIRVPRDVGISASLQGGIGEIKTRGLEERNGRWINPAQRDSPVTIRLDVKGGVGQINLIAE